MTRKEFRNRKKIEIIPCDYWKCNRVIEGEGIICSSECYAAIHKSSPGRAHRGLKMGEGEWCPICPPMSETDFVEFVEKGGRRV